MPYTHPPVVVVFVILPRIPLAVTTSTQIHLHAAGRVANSGVGASAYTHARTYTDIPSKPKLRTRGMCNMMRNPNLVIALSLSLSLLTLSPCLHSTTISRQLRTIAFVALKFSICSLSNMCLENTIVKGTPCMQWNSADSFLFATCHAMPASTWSSRLAPHNDVAGERMHSSKRRTTMTHNYIVHICNSDFFFSVVRSRSDSFANHIVGPFYSFSSLVHGRHGKSFGITRSSHHNFSLAQLLAWSKFMIWHFFFRSVLCSSLVFAAFIAQSCVCEEKWDSFDIVSWRRRRHERRTASECGYGAKLNCNCKSLRGCCGLHINYVCRLEGTQNGSLATICGRAACSKVFAAAM